MFSTLSLTATFPRSDQFVVCNPDFVVRKMSCVKRLRDKHRRLLDVIERNLMDYVSLIGDDVDNDDHRDKSDKAEKGDKADSFEDAVEYLQRVRKRPKSSFLPTATKEIYSVCRPEFNATPLLDVLVDMVLTYVFWMEEWSMSVGSQRDWSSWDLILEVSNRSQRISENGLVELFRSDRLDLDMGPRHGAVKSSLVAAIVVKPMIAGDWDATLNATSNLLFCANCFSIRCKARYVPGYSSLFYWLVNERDDQPFLAAIPVDIGTPSICGLICLNQDKHIDRIIFYLNTPDLLLRND
jgi:hypothetical protein